jgi:hypothetical protein
LRDFFRHDLREDIGGVLLEISCEVFQNGSLEFSDECLLFRLPVLDIVIPYVTNLERETKLHE